jgi:hypothetical protein
MPEKPYNPLDYENLTRNLVRELMSRDRVVLPIGTPFTGPGVYALFYEGKSPLYAAIRSPDSTHPIYVGKAVPAGARKGGAGLDSMAGQPLYSRLREHSDSIGAAKNLDVQDFRCRYLVVVPLWIVMSERFLVEHYQPVWNVCVEGFGLHDPGSGRHAGEISWWDALHPGRGWAKKLKQTRTAAEAEKHLREFLVARAAEKPKKPAP